jgi:hypothetical protein
MHGVLCQLSASLDKYSYRRLRSECYAELLEEQFIFFLQRKGCDINVLLLKQHAAHTNTANMFSIFSTLP